MVGPYWPVLGFVIELHGLQPYECSFAADLNSSFSEKRTQQTTQDLAADLCAD